MKHLRPHLDLLKALGCNVLVFAETSNAIHGDRSKPLAGRPVLAADEWKQFGARMTEVADRALAEGVRLVYHHHMGTVVESEPEIDALMAATGPSVHLLLDTGHATFAGADPAALARRYRARISHVHAKDVRADVMARARQRGLKFSRCRDCRRVHGAGRRLRRLSGGVPRATRLFRLGRGRGRAGPRQGASADVRKAGIQ